MYFVECGWFLTLSLKQLSVFLRSDDNSMITSLQNNACLVSLLSTLAETFGPVELFSELPDKSAKGDEHEKLKFFLQAFKDDLVPWCLGKNTFTSGAKLDFLISLMQEVCFSEQWCSILTFLTDGQSSVNIDQLEVLVILLEKIEGNIGKLKRKGSLPQHWHHNLLDSAAVAVATGRSSGALEASFLWYAIFFFFRLVRCCNFVK